MGLNFMGLGFSFGAKDTGLESTLAGVNDQFKQLNDSVSSFQEIAGEGLGPAENIAQDLQEQLADLAKETGGGADLADALDVGDAGETAKESLGGVTDELGGMAAEAALGGTKFGRMANSVLGGAGKITGALGWVGMAIGPVVAGFGSMAEQAGGAVDAIAGLPARAGRAISRIVDQQVNLTNSLEGEAVGYATSARAIGANMGYVGQELNRLTSRATGMSMALNIGAEETARAIRAVDEAGSELASMGLNAERDVARFTAAFGVNADVLRNAGLSMRRELNMTDDQIGLVTSAVTLMGQRTGDVAGAMGELPQVLAMLRRRRALGDTPEQVAAFSADIAAASRGLFEFTEDSDLVRSTAAELAGQLTESRESFRNMFAGAEAEFPQLLTEVSIVSRGVDQAFESMTQGPGQFIQSMGEIVQQVRESNGDVAGTLEFMRGRLQQVFGADQTATLINFWRNATDETADAMDEIRGASVDLGDLGRQAHRTGRTMQEVFERLQASFQTTMRSFARQDSRDFMRRTRESLRDLGVAAREAARSSGPLSDVMGLLSRSQQLGALALLPAELRGSAVAADQLHGQIMPLINAFASWGGILDTVLSYISIFATDVISAWGRITRTARRQGRDLDPMAALGEAIDQQAQRYSRIFIEFIGNVERWVTQAAEAFANLDFSALFETTPEGEEDQGVMGAIRRVIDRLGDVDWTQIWKNIRTGLENVFEHVRPWLEEKVDQFREIIWNRIGEWWSAIDWNEVFSGTGDLAGGLWTAVQPALMALGRMVSEWFQDHWLDIVMYSYAALGAALLALIVGAALLVVGLAVLPFVSLWLALSEGWDRWGDEITANLEQAVQDWEDIFTALGEWVDHHLLEMEAWFTRTWDETSESFEDAMLDIDATFRRTWSRISSWFSNLWTTITETFNQGVQDWQMVFETIGEFFTGLGARIRDTVGGAVQSIQDRWNTFTESLSGVWEGLSTGWTTFLEQGEAFWTALTALPERIRTGWQGMVDFFRTLFASIRQVVGEDLGQVGGFFQSVADVGSRAFAFIQQRAEETHGRSIHTIVGQDMEQVVAVMTEMANQVSHVMQTVLHDATVRAIVTGFTEGFAAVVENMEVFSEGMVEQFSTMADGISEIMTELFMSVVAQAEIAMLAAETAVEGIIGRLRTVTEAQATLASRRAEAIESLARPADEAAMRRRLAQLGGNEVLRAIHHPDWYSGTAGLEGYQALFVRHMVALRQSIEALGTAPGSGAVEERRRLIQEAREAVGRSRVGGHPGLPGAPGR